MSSKTDHICEELEKRILSGQWQDGDKIPPFSSLMKEFSVSKGMIQYAIGKLSTRGFVHTIQGQGTFVGMNKTKNLNEIVVVIIKSPSESRMLYQTKISTKFPLRNQQILSGAQREAIASDIKIIYSEIDSSHVQQNKEYLLSYNSSNILGMVILGAITPEMRPVLRKVQYPVVLTCDLADPRHRIIHEIDIVTDDIHLSSIIATEKLLEANHKKIGFVTSRPVIGWSGLYYAGWKSAVAGANIEISQEDSIIIPLSEDESPYDAGYNLASDIVKREHTAYFATEDQLALGIFEGLMDKGINVPEKISISALSDQSTYSNRYNMRVSSVLNSAYHIGRSAIYRVLDTRKYGSNPGRHTVVGVWQDGDTIAKI